MEGTISLNRAAAIKVPVKKNNVMDISLCIDGYEHRMSFDVPFSTTLTSGQRTKEGLNEIIQAMLINRFGKVIAR